MSDIDMPGTPTVKMKKSEELKIHYKKSCKFCVVSISPATPYPFDNQLPNGENHGPPHVWKGTAVVENATVKFGWAGENEKCGQKPVAGGTGGSIIIGSG